MSKRLQIIILVIAIILLASGAMILAYVYWPIEHVQFNATLSPTLMASPP